MGNFGFSYIGLIYLLMLFIPNIIWTKNMPKGYTDIIREENKMLLVFERIGQVAVTCFALIFKDFNINNLSIRSLWLLTSFIIMLIYEICWVRYFKSNKELKDFYGSFLGIPVPLATLPIIGFLLLGIYGRAVWMVIAISILGIGHIGIHLQHLKSIKDSNR